jgi:hypothetical protein
MHDNLPAFAQRVTVFGSTRNKAATSAGVSNNSASGLRPAIRASDELDSPALLTKPTGPTVPPTSAGSKGNRAIRAYFSDISIGKPRGNHGEHEVIGALGGLRRA